MTRQTRTTAERIRTGRAAVMLPATPVRRARFVDGPAGARHHLLTARAAARPAPRVIRTTHTGRRVAMRQTGRLA